MLKSTHVARNALDDRLARLEVLGFRRPANVLVAEYLAAFAAEGILDPAAAAEVSAAYNRLRYSPAADDDPQLAPAVAALDAVARRLAALTATERANLARRVRARMPAVPAGEVDVDSGLDGDIDRGDATGDALERDTECAAGSNTPVPPTRFQPAARHKRRADATKERSSLRAQSTELIESVDGPATPERRRVGLPRISLELVALFALATFFGGYFSRDVANKTVGAPGDVDESAGGTVPVLARDAWKEAGLFSYCVRARAAEEARTEEYGKARLGLELALAYAPRDASVLNDLAALYLVPDKAGGSDPQRALELAERAVASSRQAMILDTAAEAHFRCGHIGEAIRLEQELLTSDSLVGEKPTGDFRERCRKQLERYQAADRAQGDSQAASPPKAARTSRG
jgi:hypothetical protein